VAEALSVQFWSRKSPASIRSKTAKLVLACLLPSMIGFAALSYDAIQRDRSNVLNEAARRAASLQMSIDRALETSETAARALGTSPSLVSGDLAAFHAQARAILRPELAAVAFVLSDATGQPLLNTHIAYGEALPPNADADLVGKAFASGDVQISGVLRASEDQPWLVSIDVPVYNEGEVAYVLSAKLAPERIGRIVDELKLPTDWRAGILDSNYNIVSRGAPSGELVGARTHPTLIDALAVTGAGMAELDTRDGLRVLVAYARSPHSRWVGSIGVPRDAAFATQQASMANVLLTVACLMAVGFITAWVIGGRIGRSVRALRTPAVALGRGEPVLIPRLHIREAAEVGAALLQVERELQGHRSLLEERVRARTEELETAYAQLANVYATAPVGLALLDADLRMIRVNDYLAAINDKPAAEHIGKTLPELLGPVGIEFEQAYRQVRDTGEAMLHIESEGEVPFDPGVKHHWLVSYHPVFNHEHKLVGVSGLVLDVSEHRRLTDMLRDVSEQFHILYEMSGDAHMLVTPQDGFISGNRAAAAIFGCASIEQFLHLSPALTSPEFQPDGRRSDQKAQQFMQYALERGSHQFEWVHRRSDGTLFHADILLTRLDASGKQGVLQASVRDISARIDAEVRMQSLNEQLLTALERAKLANRSKSEFLANMSHEIRTPMNAIMGLARLLEESPLARRERSYVAKIKMSTRSLLGILNDVLDFSKIEAGQLALESTPFRIDQVLDSVSVLMSPAAVAKGVELVFAVDPAIPSQVVGDPMRLEQVLLNLVSNAIKFTEAGQVLLAIELHDSGAASMTLAFSVSDTGIGIAPEHHATMFDAFSQADSSTSRKFGGTGLGLTICRRLVGLMGGSIAVDSDLGKGSRFRFDTVMGVVPGAAPTALPELAGLQARRVLVVDDNAASRAALAAQCQHFGWEVTTATSGPEVLELLRAGRGQAARYDFLFIDAAMPDLDGVSVLTYAGVDPGIVLPSTALMVAEPTRERVESVATDLGLAAILVKPVTREGLIAAIVEMHTGRPAHLDAPSRPLAGQLEGIYVLLVEDNQLNQEVANYLLLHAGAAVDIASDGRVAVDMLAAAPTRYDAVLMDIQMPVMNGYEASEAIRRLGLTDLPIIAMTANVMEDDRARAFAAGLNGHIAKPIDVDAMLSTLLHLTGGIGDSGPHEQARTLAASADLSLPASIPGIDLRSTLARFGGNFANFVTLFKRFESSQGATLADVRVLLRAGEREAPQALVHRLRGVAANLGATDFAALALDFEHGLRNGSMTDLFERLDVLEVELAKLMVAARKLAVPAAPAVAGSHSDSRELPDKLAELHALLQNNNLKAIAAFEALHPDLDAYAGADDGARLADAIATLAFPQAAQMVSEILKRKAVE
jgi:PAS domain S-box-containing protein